VQEQHGRTAAADYGMYDGARRADPLRAKTREELRVDGECLSLRLRGSRPGRRQRGAARHERRRTAQQVAPIDTAYGRLSLMVESPHRRPSASFPTPS
jgi:hypothetical protein